MSLRHVCPTGPFRPVAQAMEPHLGDNWYGDGLAEAAAEGAARMRAAVEAPERPRSGSKTRSMRGSLVAAAGKLAQAIEGAGMGDS